MIVPIISHPTTVCPPCEKGRARKRPPLGMLSLCLFFHRLGVRRVAADAVNAVETGCFRFVTLAVVSLQTDLLNNSVQLALDILAHQFGGKIALQQTLERLAVPGLIAENAYYSLYLCVS